MTAVQTLIWRRPVVSFVALTYGISWSIWITLSQVLADPSLLVVLPGGFGPAVAAAIVVATTGGSLRVWIQDMVHWRIAPRWYLAALGLPLLFTAGESLVYVVAVGSLDLSLILQKIGFLTSSFLFALLLGGGNEELGWRGFMQPRLQRSYSAVTAAIIVGIVWTVWHLPVQLFLPSLSALSTTDQILMRVATVPLAILFAWLYNAADGSVIIPMLFHAGWNSSGILLPAPIAGLSSETLLLVKSARYGTMLIIVGVLLMIYDHDSLAPGGKHTQRTISARDEASPARSR